MEHFSAAPVQEGLIMGSEVEGTAFTSGQRSRTIMRLIWHRRRALCRNVVWVEHCVERHGESWVQWTCWSIIKRRTWGVRGIVVGHG
jgi:hypothetical protein